MSAPSETGAGPRRLWRRILRRGPWENLATVLIAAGVVMLMQPISIDLYSYSLVTMLTGTVMFIIVTKFPD
jgi:hypothetical protein